jgi:Kef-type K+ transport system membrane component KefB
MATPAPAAPASRPRYSGILLTAVFLVIAAILFYLVYLAFPASQHYWGLIWIGILALVFAVVCYLAESLSRDPTAQRSLAWGFFGMGFAVLFLTIGLAPSYGVSLGTWQLVGLLIVAIALAISIALIGWRLRALQSTAARQVAREEWRQRPAPSAFSYAAANSPSVPSTAPPPSTSGTPPTPPRSP